MGFATIIAFLGFGIALVALWLVSDVLKKVENQNEKFLRAHIAAIREEIRSTDKDVAKLAKAVNDLTESAALTDKRISDHTKDFETVRARISKVAEDLDMLDRSVPQRYRVRVATPSETENKPGVKAKPTVQ